MGKTILVIIVIFMVIVVGWIGLSVWSASCAGPDISGPGMPDEKKATHEFFIENTGGIILSSDFEQYGQVKGKRVFSLHGYWEMRGNDFKLVEGDIILDERIFGPIQVKRR